MYKVKYQLLILILFFILSLISHASDLRLTSIEWEPIEGATFYEIELRQTFSINENQIKRNEKTNQSNWKSELPPGIYQLKIRSYDQRKVAGEYSEPIQLIVQLDKPKLNKLKSVIISENQDVEKINLSWSSVPHAKKYKIQIQPVNGKVIQLETTEPEIHIELPVAKKYSWTVQAMTENQALQSEQNELQDFQIIGGELAAPEINNPENEFVRQMTWQKSSNVQKYQYEILYNNNDQWETMQKGDTAENKVKFNKNNPGGKYQIRLQSFADLRQPSKITTTDFYVIQGDRSKSAESSANQKRAITIPDGIYVQARYSLSDILYTNKYADLNQNTKFNAVSAIAGIGLGVTSKFSSIGYIGSIDYGGLGYNDQTIQFYNLEMNITSQYDLSQSKYQFFAGAIIKQFPSIGSDRNSVLIPKNLSTYGFHLGTEYWYAITGQFGIQANLHLYEYFGTIETPNKEPIKATLATQSGIMGAYRVTPMTTGYIGYMKKIDQIKYEHSDDSSSITDNEITMKGDYISLIIESNFEEINFFANQNLNETRNQGFYYLTRFFLANMNYVNASVDSGTRTAFNAMSGIGGFGLGSIFDNSNWGFVGYLDYAGIGYNNQNIQFASIDLNSSYDVDLSSSKFRILNGITIKQLPSIMTNSNSNIEAKMTTGYGIHIGAEYTYLLNSTIGIQSNIHYYEILGKISSPNDQKIIPSTSSQLGIMGKYKMTANMNGLAGFTTRVDQIKFSASPYAASSDENKIHIQGQYLNMTFEYNY